MKGYIFKKPCEKCGNVKSVAHHEDYDKPLEIVWLCQPCHSHRHKQMKEEF
jgi:ribosomal protein S27AE